MAAELPSNVLLLRLNKSALIPLKSTYELKY